MKFIQVSGPLIAGIQYFALVCSIVGAFFVNWSFSWMFVVLFFFYLYGAIGISMVLHRYWSHRSFEFRNSFLKWLFTGIAVAAGRGSPLAWVHIHRTHHTYSDTNKDPHRPTKFTLFSFKTTYIRDVKIFLIKDLMTQGNKIIHEYYLLFVLAWCALLFFINPALLYFAWILPVCLNQIAQDMWNYFSHVNVGYRTFETKDNSRNVSWLWPLILGEAWHNNHHHDPKSYNMSRSSSEFDPIACIIDIVKK